MVAAEAVPFAKEGGLGDVMGSLPKFLAGKGHDVRVVMPRYDGIDSVQCGLTPLVGPLGVPMGDMGELWCAVFRGNYPGTDIPVYFIAHEHFFKRKGIYNSENGRSYTDNDRRFIFLSRASLQLCKILDFKPAVISVHDWHTASIPVLLNTVYRDDSFFARTATVLTIHNMQHQGVFPRRVMDILGVGDEHFNVEELEFFGNVNLMKGGIVHASLLATVSPTYAMEIQTPEFGCGLEGVINKRHSDLHGVLNGVDYDEWNPETDPFIAAHYSEHDLPGKALCKQDLQREFGLTENAGVPVIGLVSRLVKQKGIDILAGAIHRLLRLNIQCVLLGAGEEWAHSFFGDLPRRYPGKFGCHIGYNNMLAHKIEAGADFFLMPSRFEPCGMNQMFSLRYGTLPIVSATGGLNDTVTNFSEETLEGTGFKFRDLTPDSLFNTVEWAVRMFYTRKDLIEMIIKRAMTMRFTWDDAADQYEKVFFAAVRGRLSEDEFRQRFGEILTRGIQTRSAGNFITVRGAEEHRVSVFEEV
jgi:starch synthase